MDTYQTHSLTEEENNRVKNDFRGYVGGAVRVGEQKFFFQGNFYQHAENIRNFQMRDNDVFVGTFPRCGTTWTQEMVWLLVHDLDYEGARQIIDRRFPYFDADVTIDSRAFELPEVKKHLKVAIKVNSGDRMREADQMPSPRCLKTHLPCSLMPQGFINKAKFIYVARDPRDVVVSLFHHHRLIRTYGFSGSFDQFFQYYIDDEVVYSPFWGHVKDAWKMKYHHNFLFLTFEDMKKDLKANIVKTANFLGKTLTESQLDKLSNHLQFDSMKKNPAVNGQHDIDSGVMDVSQQPFIRKGLSGGWKSALNDSQKEKIQKWCDQNSDGIDKELGYSSSEFLSLF